MFDHFWTVLTWYWAVSGNCSTNTYLCKWLILLRFITDAKWSCFISHCFELRWCGTMSRCTFTRWIWGSVVLSSISPCVLKYSKRLSEHFVWIPSVLVWVSPCNLWKLFKLVSIHSTKSVTCCKIKLHMNDRSLIYIWHFVSVTDFVSYSWETLLCFCKSIWCETGTSFVDCPWAVIYFWLQSVTVVTQCLDIWKVDSCACHPFVLGHKTFKWRRLVLRLKQWNWCLLLLSI